jgi:hypothetical protein
MADEIIRMGAVTFTLYDKSIQIKCKDGSHQYIYLERKPTERDAKALYAAMQLGGYIQRWHTQNEIAAAQKRLDAAITRPSSFVWEAE